MEIMLFCYMVMYRKSYRHCNIDYFNRNTHSHTNGGSAPTQPVTTTTNVEFSILPKDTKEGRNWTWNIRDQPLHLSTTADHNTIKEHQFVLSFIEDTTWLTSNNFCTFIFVVWEFLRPNCLEMERSSNIWTLGAVLTKMNTDQEKIAKRRNSIS